MNVNLVTLRASIQKKLDIQKPELQKFKENVAARKEFHPNEISDIQKMKGRISVYETYTTCFDLQEGDIADLYLSLLKIATQGADDVWSGRNNDARRAFHDGMLEAIRNIADESKYHLIK